MAAIVQTFSGDNALSLANEEFVRRMAWGSDWKRLRIAVNHSGQFVGNFSNEFYYIGLCQGTTNTFKGTTDEWVGFWVGSSPGTWSYTAGPPAGVTQGGSNGKWGYKIGGVLTQSGATSVNNYIGKTNRDFWWVDIEQTSTGYNVGRRTPSAVPAVDIFGRDFEMRSNQAELSYSAVNFATNRLLDSVSVYWTYAAVPLEISEILVVRYA